jgi:hypothetical protein
LPPAVVLLVDALINLLLGLLLIIFPAGFAGWLGVPLPQSRFYVNILGAVFVGIAIALVWEARRDPRSMKSAGLGVTGAAAINLCGGVMLVFWLTAGKLDLNPAGEVFLWLLALLLVGISAVELYQTRE